MKKQVMTSISDELHVNAKDRGWNISDILENAIRDKLNSKKELPEEVITIKCSICGKEIEEGFLCRQRKLILCNDCQKDFKMSDCPHDYEGMHEHIKWPGFHNLNEEVIPEIEQMQKEKNKENGL